MNFSRFFIQRPIFAGVLSILIFLVGLIALPRLPISEYPEVVPPTVVVRAVYPGASPEVIAETVAAPLEQQINGVENGLYMSSQATTDGTMTLTITFSLGTDLDKAQMQVQNRVSQALPKLPEEVRRLGVVTVKSSPELTMVVHLFSPDGRYDDVYMRNYAALQIKDVLARLPGVGQVQLFGSGDYSMRVWLDPERMAARSLVPGDVVRAIREQNQQVAAGSIGQPPTTGPMALTMSINAHGRLVEEAEFEEIVVKVGPNGETTLLKDVARVELAASEYSLRSLLDNRVAVALPIFQLPGSNAIELSDSVRASMAEMKQLFPEGLDYSVVYDPTVFVRSSIRAVVTTLIEAVLLVVLVVIVFLQTWRASVIPLAAVPVSLIGTFAVLHALGFSINALSLFGLVLAIGIVVDDAIVVVENVERNIASGLTPLEATKKAMGEVTGPIVATALVLCAVFVPTAFISGLTGQFYKQFALTIAISTVISAFNSLTFSPALAAVLLRGHDQPKDALSRGLDRLLGWFFRPFNRFFEWASARYSAGVAATIKRSSLALVVYAGLLVLTWLTFERVPSGFVPVQDKQYLVAFARLPDGASLDRTEGVIREMSKIALEHPGVEHSIAFPGLSISGFANSAKEGIVFVGLKPFEQRRSDELSAGAIAAGLQAKYAGIQEGFVAIFPPPPVMGLGSVNGFKMQIEDRANLGAAKLFEATQALIAEAYRTPEIAGVFTGFGVGSPQLFVDVDRAKAKTQGVMLGELFETIQVYLGSLYVNDFNRFGRTYQVIAQADSSFRDSKDDVASLETRNVEGRMVPLGTLVDVVETGGPDRMMRYNAYASADVNGAPAPGYSSGQAEAALARIAAEKLPPGMAFEWTDLTYQRILAGNSAVWVFPLSVLLVFLVLAAQYESLRLPLAVILIVPLTLLSALVGVLLSSGDNNVFTQIGLIVLLGLAAKNAILIVEFAKVRQDEGLSPVDAALEAARLRLRPILMTSIAFIAGVWPLVTSTGAGAEMRRAMGVAVFSGMIGVTFFGLLLTPVFYVVLMRRRARSAEPRLDSSASRGDAADEPGMHGAAPVVGAILAVSLFVAGCSVVGPDYVRPEVGSPAAFRGVDHEAAGEPLDARWWAVFEDAELSELVERALSANQDVLAAAARVDRARALAGLARSELVPDIRFEPSVRRDHYSPLQEPSFGDVTATTWRVPLTLAYEVDLWGRIRRASESALAAAQASEADRQAVRLAVAAEIARDYFALRDTDEQREIVRDSLGLRREALDLVRARADAGTASDLDVARAETELAAVETALADLDRARSVLESSLAVLSGVPAPDFDIADRGRYARTVPAIPPGLPSQLLARRPDVAAAERELAATNAQIGVAKAAYLPTIGLTGSLGVASAELGDLVDGDASFWSIGPSLSLPLIDGGRRRANLDAARAEHEEALARYRGRALVAFAEVQRALSAIALLRAESEIVQRGFESASRAARLARTRYEGGVASYLEVVDAERTALASEREVARITSVRRERTVELVRALGGGWDESRIAIALP